MTQLPRETITLRALDIPTVVKLGVGFDTMFDELLRAAGQKATNYPPHNLIQLTEDRYIVELAVAGFSEGEIDITVENNILIVSGSKLRNEEESHIYHHRGISSRDFIRPFPLAEYVEVVNANCQNGILSITLERLIPEDKKPKRIAIKYHK